MYDEIDFVGIAFTNGVYFLLLGTIHMPITTYVHVEMKMEWKVLDFSKDMEWHYRKEKKNCRRKQKKIFWRNKRGNGVSGQI